MGEVIQIEYKKLWKAKPFWISLISGVLMSGLAAWYYISAIIGGLDIPNTWLNPNYHATNMYSKWIGNEAYSFGFSLFYFLFPVMCLLPYGWSMAAELQSGYVKNVVTRVNRKDYFRKKYWVTFWGGGLAVTIPLVMNLIAVAMFFTPIKPCVWYPYYSMLQTDFMSDLFYTHPFLFVLCYLLIGIIYFGLLAGLSWCVAFFVKNKVLSVILPVGMVMLLHYFSGMISYKFCKYDLSPLYCIHPTLVRYHTSGWVIVAYMVFMAVTAYLIARIKGTNAYEIY